ncbi:uncharacterized protein LOC143176322 [Nomia melanderi]|uniref:uncharacterized protein LOC143176322 n=1 Tax=Nomia melanderi TaxID=2448451 RepID=UPI003FCC45D5
MEGDLRSLISERGTVKAALTRFRNFFRDSANTTAIGSLKKRLEANTQLFDNFNKIQTKIEMIVIGTDAETAHTSEREAFETAYFDLIDEVETHIEKFNVRNRRETPVSPATTSNSIINVRLPTMQLPLFDGNYSDWIKFRDTFTALIHENETLSDVQRFHYLNSSVKGAAARVIQSLGISEANYNLAWDLLRSRYENSTNLKRHHVNSIIDLKSVHKQTEVALREFIDDITSHRNALRSLGDQVDSWDTFLIPLLSRKLDLVSGREWERKIASNTKMSSFAEFSEFIEERAKYLGNIASSNQLTSQRFDQRIKLPGSQRVNAVTSHIIHTNSCPVCKGTHSMYHCDKFKALDPDNKTQIVKEARVCYNCLQSGHRVKECTRSHCKICGKKHHSLLHRDDIHSVKSVNSNCNTSTNLESVKTQPLVTHIARESAMCTMLSTAVVYISDHKGQFHKCRVLLDSGSQANFITSEFCKRIGIRTKPIESIVTGLGRALNSIKGKTTVKIHSKFNKYQDSIDCLLIDTITTNMPNFPLTRDRIEIPTHIELADPEFNVSKPIDMLIGASLFWSLLCVGQHKFPSGIILQKTQLGWVIGGTFTWTDKEPRVTGTCHLATHHDLQSQLEKFWMIEEINPQETRALDECEAHFRKTTRRTTDGRYIVRIPFKDNIADLGESRHQAERRLYALERKLSKTPQLKQQYVEFLEEYEKLGHMSRVLETPDTTAVAYYLPHHAVSKISSTTTKVRVVFDGSAKSASGLSLNDTQLVGPTVQNDLISILIRFRYYKYVISADIEKMYRQVLIEPRQRKFQRILWRSDPHSPITEFELNTVTYGTASAPFLATRVLREIGLQCTETAPDISKIIMNDFYVDDLLTGAQTSIEISTIKSKLTTILSQAGMHLRKWATNCPDIITTPGSNNNSQETIIERDPKTLGLSWSPRTDELNFMIQLDNNRRTTKRTILSEIARLFEPLGLLGPFIVIAKLILQRLWQVQAGWDESVSQELSTQWLEYREDIQRIQTLKIPRCTMATNLDINTRLELHGFSDASEKAYGACIYLRSRDTAGQWTAALLCAKSRVAPLKAISLPRLELCGAVLLANLIQKVRTALHLVNPVEHLWTDSTITLAWLRSMPSRWKTFVANRVSEIQTLTSVDSWKHVTSEDNPADMISRGVRLSVLAQAKNWWSGPAWLCDDAESWPTPADIQLAPVLEERVTRTVLTAFTHQECSIFEKFSKYTRLLRVTTYCIRFTRNIQAKITKGDSLEFPKIGPLTTTELDDARTRLERLVQRDAFETEITALRANQSLPRSSPLRSLNPFLDNHGILRVGGRLRNAPFSYDIRHPVILPSKHPFVELIIRYEHERLLHAGCQAVIASLHERYWPLSCKPTVKRILRRCVRCFRVKPTSEEYQMGSLPAPRVTPARPFNTCGTDYAGPFFTKERTRGKVTVKAYICIFVCFVTKAVHIELATNLSTDAFINCFQRFIARRGRCQYIASDNGTNFIGARNELAELGALIRSTTYNQKIATELSQEGIEWRLIPPHSPHFGGLWEGVVKSAKYHLTRVIGDQRLTFEELYTLLTQVESCLNSRPLSPLSSDPTDLLPLTPGHFLIGTALTALPTRDLRDVPTTRLNRYELIQQMFQHFWQRWQKECIHHMQQRHKWQQNSPNKIEIDTLVIMKEDNQPPLQWKLGRVVQLHPGRDGITRVASLRTSSGLLKRPVRKLCILPVDAKAEATSITHS